MVDLILRIFTTFHLTSVYSCTFRTTIGYLLMIVQFRQQIGGSSVNEKLNYYLQIWYTATTISLDKVKKINFLPFSCTLSSTIYGKIVCLPRLLYMIHRTHHQLLDQNHHQPRYNSGVCSVNFFFFFLIFDKISNWFHFQLTKSILLVWPCGVWLVDSCHFALSTAFSRKGDFSSKYFETTNKQNKWRSIPFPHMASW